MSYVIEVDAAAHIAYLRGSGGADPDRDVAVLDELAAHPDFEPGFALVFDLRGMQLEPSADGMMRGLDNVVRFKPLLRGRIAFVAPPALELSSEVSAALYGAHGLDVRAFSDIDEARSWAEQGDASPSPA